MRSVLRQNLSAYILLLIVGLFYLLTVSHHLYWGDSAEFVLVSKYLGISHPTGYPLFCLLGRIFSILPLSTLPFRINVISTISALGAVFILYQICQLLTGNHAASFIAGLTFAFSYELWDQATKAEVYAPHTLFIAIIIYFLLKFRLKERPSVFILIFYLFGLALSNHLTALLIIPPLLYITIIDRVWNKDFKLYLWLFLFLLIPLTVYFYLPFRSLKNPPLDYDNPENLHNIIKLVSGQEFRYRFYIPNMRWLIFQIKTFILLLMKQYYHFLIPGFVGLAAIYKKNKRLFFFTLLIIFFNVGYTILYNIPDKEGYYLPTYFTIGIYIGMGIYYIINKYRFLTYLIVPTLIVMVSLNFPKVNKRHNQSLEDLTSVILKTVPRNSILFVDDLEVYFGLVYRQMEKNEGKEVTLISDYWLKLPWYIKHLRDFQTPLKIDSRLDKLISETEGKISHLDPVNYGEQSKQLVKIVKKKLVDDNIGLYYICFFFYDDSEWARSWEGYYLKPNGLVYQVMREPPSLDVFPTPFPPPRRYSYEKSSDKNERYVTLRFAAALNRLGIINVYQHNYPEAIENFYLALQYYKGYNQVYKNLGVAYLNQGDTLMARKVWGEFLKLAPDDPQAPEIKTWLQTH